MGRPALYLRRTHISFSTETLARLDAIVGEKGRAAFIRKATEQMLDAVELANKLTAEQAKRPK